MGLSTTLGKYIRTFLACVLFVYMLLCFKVDLYIWVESVSCDLCDTQISFVLLYA
jgi:hypothetical protein